MGVAHKGRHLDVSWAKTASTSSIRLFMHVAFSATPVAGSQSRSAAMGISVISLRALPLVLLLLSTAGVSSQETNANTTDFSCHPGSPAPCNTTTYVVYRAQPPEFLDIRRISDLFGSVGRLSIAKANNLTAEEADQLLPGQLLLVPISCGCTGNRSFANITYQIRKDNTFFLVSAMVFERLTDVAAVEDLNPTLKVGNLTVGAKVVFPIYCKCPTRTLLQQGFKYLITYVWQAGDSLEQLSRTMNTSMEAILSANNGRNLTAAVDHPVLIPVSKLPELPRTFPSTTQGGKNKPALQRTVIIASCAAGAAVASILYCSLLFMYNRYNRIRAFAPVTPGSEAGGLRQVGSKPSEGEHSCPKNPQDKLLLTGVSDCLDKPVAYCTEAIMAGTGNLDEKCRIGGAVFRATIDGQLLAVKKAKGNVSEELKILQRVNHANLVKLTGISTSSDGDFFLVYEYAENGSLHGWLHQQVAPLWSSSSFPSWQQRLSIALGVANGLQYLHQHTSPSIVHGDIRATNILLDAHFKAKISNFSKAKPAGADAAATPEADVFSFGLLLLELLSGRKAVETRENGEVAMSCKDVRAVLEGEEGIGERLRRWMDPNMEGFYPMGSALTLAAMAKACTSEMPSERPSMGEMAFGLSVLAQFCMGRTRTSSNFCENVHIPSTVFSR